MAKVKSKFQYALEAKSGLITVMLTRDRTIVGLTTVSVCVPSYNILRKHLKTVYQELVRVRNL